MKVSICVPIFNGERFLNDCLNSILVQDYFDFELVVSDDNSIDSSLLLVNDFLIKNSWIKSKVVINKNRGIGNNWNNCLRHSSGEYIKFLFQDDVLEPDCLKRMTSILDSNLKLGLVGCKRNILVNLNNQEFISEWKKRFSDLQKDLNKDLDGNILINKRFFKSKYFFLDPINKIGEPSTIMFRKSVIHKVGYFSQELIQTLDFEYWFRILKYYEILILNEKLVNFRLHINQATFVNKNEYKFEYLKLYNIFINNFFWLFSLSNKIRVLEILYPSFARLVGLKNVFIKKLLK